MIEALPTFVKEFSLGTWKGKESNSPSKLGTVVRVEAGSVYVAAGGVNVADGGVNIADGGVNVNVAAGGVNIADGGVNVATGTIYISPGGIYFATGARPTLLQCSQQGIRKARWALTSPLRSRRPRQSGRATDGDDDNDDEVYENVPMDDVGFISSPGLSPLDYSDEVTSPGASGSTAMAAPATTSEGTAISPVAAVVADTGTTSPKSSSCGTALPFVAPIIVDAIGDKPTTVNGDRNNVVPNVEGNGFSKLDFAYKLFAGKFTTNHLRKNVFQTRIFWTGLCRDPIFRLCQ
uniref:Uncharacterized protein n=1 Tax=Amphora coffeiformis TaxID=265554 RepID=A0A7S3L6R2_9STRA